MANKLTTTRIRLPPIDESVHDLVTGFPFKRTDSKKHKNVLARQKNTPDQQVGFPPIVHPPYRQQFSSYHKRKSLHHSSMKITHTEKIPTRFPGKTFAVLPPIGGSSYQEHNDRPSDEKPSTQPAETTKKPAKRKAVKKTESTDTKVSNESSTIDKSKRVIKKQISALGLVNIDRKPRKLEYEVGHNSPNEPQTPASTSKSKDLNKPKSLSPTNAEIFQRQSDLQNDGDDEDDGDDSTMMKLSEVLQFLEWSSELREFLNGKNSSRRDATCSGIDPMLPHAVDVIRDILLKQTMEELCMMW